MGRTRNGLVALGLFASGCIGWTGVTRQLYPGPRLPEAEGALLTYNNTGKILEALAVDSVDGSLRTMGLVRENETHFFLQPGRHVVTLSPSRTWREGANAELGRMTTLDGEPAFTNDNEEARKGRPTCEIPFDAAAAKTYTVVATYEVLPLGTSSDVRYQPGGIDLSPGLFIISGPNLTLAGTTPIGDFHLEGDDETGRAVRRGCVSDLGEELDQILGWAGNTPPPDHLAIDQEADCLALACEVDADHQGTGRDGLPPPSGLGLLTPESPGHEG